MSDSNTPPLWLQVPEPHDLVKRYGAAADVPAFGGRLEVDWSPGERVTSVGGLVFFATFLKETGLFVRLCEDFPVCYRSNNSCSKRDIVGTAVLAILLGKTRYVHIEAIRHDEAARELLGLGEIVSDATVRRQRMEGLRLRLGGSGAAGQARRMAAETPRAVHTASRREEGRDRRAEEDRQEAEGPKEVDRARPDGPRSREAGGVLPMAEVNCRAFGREDTLVRRPAVRFSQVADAGTAVGGGNSAPIVPRRRIGQARTGFRTEAGRQDFGIGGRPPRKQMASKAASVGP